MQKSNDDCFYFLTSICAKGPACPYRHNPTVLTCNVTCPTWLRGNCIDPACPLRHNAVQRPSISNGITCFYENTPMGCLKLDCTFIHLRPRPNSRNSSTLRPSTTNLVNKDAIKPTTVINPPSTPTSAINESVPSPQIISSQPPTPKIETPSLPETSSPTVKTETISNRIPTENEQRETTNRNGVTNSPEKTQDDTKTPSRVIVNRNVVIAESNRKVVHGSSNRVVVSSDTIKKKITNDSDSDLDDLIEEENDTKNTNSLIDIPFPCSVPSITNRLFMSSKPSTPTNDTKPIRLNRDRLPATKISISNSISSPSNGEKTSAGTGLLQDDERRTSRIERFKKKPISPPRSVVNSSSSTPTRNAINSPPNERKRPAPDQIINDCPPAKRLSSQQETNHHHNTTTIGDLCSPPASPRRTHNRRHRRRRSSPSPSPSSSPSPSPSPPPQRKSPPRSTYSSTSTMNDSTWKNEVEAFIAKTTQPKPIVLPKPVPLLSLRPRYRPPPPPPQQQPQPLMALPHRPRQPPPPPPPPPVAITKPLVLVITPSQIPSKPVEQLPSPPAQSSTNSKEEDENRLLEFDELTDVVDTFAFIDEAILEADIFLD